MFLEESMAAQKLVNCPDCDHQVSRNAEQCPNCGAPLKNGKIKKKSIGCFTAILIVIFFNVIMLSISAMIPDSPSSKPSDNKAPARETKVTIDPAVRINELESQVKTIPASQYKKNLDIYKELLELEPSSQRYKNKVSYYSNKWEEQQAESNRRRKKHGNPPMLGWGNVVYQVEDYLERITKDPDSLEISGCSEILYSERGWVTSCDWRARNSFGGFVREINKFYISHSQVILME